VLRYAIGQEYKKHRDTLKDSDAGPRVVTVLFYLSDVEEGGETAFPMVDEWMNPEQQKRYGPFSDCAKGKLAVRPRKVGWGGSRPRGVGAGGLRPGKDVASLLGFVQKVVGRHAQGQHRSGCW
jgi:hypothetical protein